MPLQDYIGDRRRADGPAEAFTHIHDAGLSLADAGELYFFTCPSCPEQPIEKVHQSC